MSLPFLNRVKRRWNHYVYRMLHRTSPVLRDAKFATLEESKKRPNRTEILNYLIELSGRQSGAVETCYLEIGVRNPAANFNKIRASKKFGVDPGVEDSTQSVDFPMTSDLFFAKFRKGGVLTEDTLFDVVFIDGLHLAEQVDRDIANALSVIKEYGFVVLHDCNPPTEWHARETYKFYSDQTQNCWNGSTWKAFAKWRSAPGVASFCIDADYGVGILSKSFPVNPTHTLANPFFEYSVFAANRTSALNLLSFADFQAIAERVVATHSLT